MSYQPAILQPGLALPAAATPIVPVSAVRSVLRAAVFTNISAAAVALTVEVVRADKTTKTMISGRAIQPGESYVSRELPNHVLAIGDMLQGTASTADTIHAVISGLTF